MNVFLLLEFWSLVLSYLFLEISTIGVYPDDGTINKCGRVFITISASHKNKIVLNWSNKCGPDDIKPYRVYLTHSDISNITDYDFIHYITCEKHENASYRTDISFPGWKSWYPSGSVNLGLWIASVTTDGNVLDSRPFRLYPTWMTDNRATLRFQPFGEIVIPGTHNSGSYEGSGLFGSYIYNQEYNIKQQLEAGIRYFDFQVGYYATSNNFYITNDFKEGELVEIMYLQILGFLSISPCEIIMIDFHSFTRPHSWSESLHRKFMRYTLDALGSKVFIPDSNANQPKGPTLEEVWKSGKNILLTYNDGIRKEFKEFLPQFVAQHWMNTLDVGLLRKFLQNSVNARYKRTNYFIALMAILTFREIDIRTLKNNLRTLADYVNPEVTKWVRDEWRHEVNIIATDYFFGNNLIELAIEINTKRVFNGTANNSGYLLGDSKTINECI